MSASRRQPDTSSRQAATVVVLLVATAVSAVLVFPFFGPWMIPLWLGVTVAAFVSPPPVLTGPKDPSGRATAAGPGERAASERFALARTLQSSMLGGHDGWVPGKRVRLSFVYALLCGVLALSWPLWDAVVAFAPWVVWLHAGFAWVTVAGVDAAWRNARQPLDPCPGVTAGDVWDHPRRALVITGGLVAAALMVAGLWWLVLSEVLPTNVVWHWGFWPFAGSAAALVGVGVAHMSVRSAALAPWHAQIAARAVWNGRWAESKAFVKNPPVMVSHTDVGPIAVDVFEVPAVIGDAQSFVLSHSRAVGAMSGGGQVTAVMHVPNIDPNTGADVAGTVHPTRVKVASWAEGSVPGVSDPGVDPEVALLLLESGITRAVMDFNPAWVRPVWVGAHNVAVEPASSGPADQGEQGVDVEGLLELELDPAEDGGDDDHTAIEVSWWSRLREKVRVRNQPVETVPHQVPPVWCVELATTTISVGWNHLRGELLGGLHTAMGTDVAVGRRDPIRLYVGPANQVELEAAMPRPAAYSQVSPHQFLDDLAEESEWDVRWGAVAGVGVNIPTPQFTVRETARLPAGAEVHYLPFLTRNGEPAQPLMTAKVEAQMATGLRASPFTSIQPYPRNARRHDGSRNPQALVVVWSAQAMPMSPAKTPPPPTGRTGLRSASMLVLRAQLDRAFDAARLDRPEVIEAEALTGATSREHVWKLRVALYGGVTLDRLRSVESKLSGALSVPWIRFRQDPTDGVVQMFMGNPARATYVNEATAREVVAQLNWSQAFAEANILGSNGRAPELVSHRTLEHNDKVEVIDFELPTPVSVERIRGVKAKLAAASGNVYLDIRPGPSGAQSARITACVEDPMPSMAPFDWAVMDELAADGKGSVAFATGVDGSASVWNPKESPHLLVAGSTGTGKSVLMQALLCGATLNGWDMYVVDPSKSAADFQFMGPYARATAVDVFTADGVLAHVYDEVKRRKLVNAEYGVGSYRDLPDGVRPPHVMLMIDEFTSLLTADPVGKQSDSLEVEAARAATIAANDARARIGTAVGRIAREARSAGVTLVLGTQKLSAAMMAEIPGAADLKSNLARIVLGNTTYGDRQSGLRNADDAPDLGDDIPAGRGVYEPSSSRPRLIQAWYDPGEQDMMRDELATRVSPLPTSEQIDLSVFAPETGSGLDALLGGDDSTDLLLGGEADDPVVEDLGEVEIDWAEFGFVSEPVGDTPANLASPTDPPESADAAPLEPNPEISPTNDVLEVWGDGTGTWPSGGNELRLTEDLDMNERIEVVRRELAGRDVSRVVWVDAALKGSDPVFGEPYELVVREIDSTLGWETLPDPSQYPWPEGAEPDPSTEPELTIPLHAPGRVDAPAEAKRLRPPAIDGVWGDGDDNF